MKSLQTCLPHRSYVATLPWEVQKSHFFSHYYSHTSNYLRYLKRKQIATVILQL